MKKIMFFLLVSCSIWAQQEPMEEFNFEDFSLIVDVEDREKYFNEINGAASAKDLNMEQKDEYLTNLAIGWLAKGNIGKYRHYTQTGPEFSFVALVDLIYALEHLEKNDENLPVIKEVSSGMMAKLGKEEDMDELTLGRFQVLLELNAMANAKMGNVKEALTTMERSSAIEGDRDSRYFKDSRSSYYDRYAIVLSAAGEHKRALDTLVNAVKNADSKPKLIETLKEIYKRVHGSDKGANDLIASLRKKAYQKYYEEIEGSFIEDTSTPVTGTTVNLLGDTIQAFAGNRTAGKVSIPDINGNMVDLADYHGKILAIDFWTTGCTPCVAAFAGFKRVVDEYENEPFQLFVINLFETQKTVQSFIARKGIDLDVLHDEPNAAYEVRATPTKIIFDPMGNIRFYSVAYAGSTDREYYKLKAMVEIVKKRAS
ncbi:peroxiredoxin family protein [Maribacter sp. X9]|uniref:peroxiredoxin family protein n=1 Tax=Maribacter sp. X9 TaxID=3402159 RepID=UPI003AF3C43C